MLDPFGGSDTTMIAAEATKGALMEIDPLYCDTIVERRQKFAKQEARLASTNATFAEVRADRSKDRKTES